MLYSRKVITAYYPVFVIKYTNKAFEEFFIGGCFQINVDSIFTRAHQS